MAGVLEGEEEEGLLQALGCWSECKGCCGVSVVLGVPLALWWEERAEHCRGVPAQPLEPILQIPAGLGLRHITRVLCGGEQGGKHGKEGGECYLLLCGDFGHPDPWGTRKPKDVRDPKHPLPQSARAQEPPPCTLAQDEL